MAFRWRADDGPTLFLMMYSTKNGPTFVIFQGIRTNIAKEPYILVCVCVWGGGGGVWTPLSPLDSIHVLSPYKVAECDLKHKVLQPMRSFHGG